MQVERPMQGMRVRRAWGRGSKGPAGGWKRGRGEGGKGRGKTRGKRSKHGNSKKQRQGEKWRKRQIHGVNSCITAWLVLRAHHSLSSA